MRLHLCRVGEGKGSVEEDICVRTMLATLAAKIAPFGCKIERRDADVHRDDRRRTVINACPALHADLCHGAYEARRPDADFFLDLSSKKGSPG
jgi:hypothetical protein